MIQKFTMNKSKNTASLKLGGKGFHQDLHRLCKVVDKEHRRFDGEYWHIQHAREYAEKFGHWWPEFRTWVEDFEKQLELI